MTRIVFHVFNEAMVECKICKTLLENYSCNHCSAMANTYDLCKSCALKKVLFRLEIIMIIVLATGLINLYVLSGSIWKGFLFGMLIVGLEFPIKLYVLEYGVEAIKEVLDYKKGIIYTFAMIIWKIFTLLLFYSAKIIFLTVIFGIYEIPALIYDVFSILLSKERKIDTSRI